MGYSINRIPIDNVNFYSSIGDLWLGSTGDIPIFSAYESKHVREGSLVWEVRNGYVFSFNWDYGMETATRNSIVTTDDDNDDYVESFVWVKSPVSMNVSIQTIITHNITLDPILTLEHRSETNNIRLISGEWYLLRANPIQVPNDIHRYSISLEITVTECLGEILDGDYDFSPYVGMPIPVGYLFASTYNMLNPGNVVSEVYGHIGSFKVGDRVKLTGNDNQGPPYPSTTPATGAYVIGTISAVNSDGNGDGNVEVIVERAVSNGYTDIAFDGMVLARQLFISHPTTYCQNDFIRNTAWFDTWYRMPSVMKDSDSRLAKPSYSLSRFIELCCEHRGEIYDILDEINYVDTSDGYNPADNLTKSTIVDPDVISRKYAFWVAQFVGTQLYSPTVSVTPWQNIPATWQGIDAIDTVVDINDTVGWSALQSFKPELVGLDEYFRWQISTGYYGINAGSLQAVTESIKRILTGTKSVRVEANPSSWVVNVYTYKSETLGTDLLGTGDEVQASQIILKRCKPAGFFVRHYLESTETPA